MGCRRGSQRRELATRLAESVIVNGSGMPDTLQQRLDGVVPSSVFGRATRMIVAVNSTM